MKSDTAFIPGLLLTLLGVVLLGDINNWWDWDWRFFASLWPLVLILIGIRFLLPRTNWANWAFLSIIVLGTVGMLAAPTSVRDDLTGGRQSHLSTHVEQPGGKTVTRLKLQATAAASDFTVNSLPADSPLLYSATSRGAELKEIFNSNGTEAHAKLEPKHDNNWFVAGRSLDISIARQPALELMLDSGASQSELDLTELNLESLKVDGGASNLTVTLGTKSPRQTLRFDGGASTLHIRVPTSAALKLSKDGGLTTDNFGSLGLTEHNSTFTSADFDTASTQITVKFDGGVSTINIERY